MLVIDASAVAEPLLGRPAGDSVAGNCASTASTSTRPTCSMSKVLSALRRVVTAGDAVARTR